jgi:hypothetical protein
MRIALLLAVALVVGGCNIVGAVASKMPARIVPAAYDGLPNQRAMVMVYTDSGTRIDFSQLELDLNFAVQNNLLAAGQEGVGTLQGVSFPYQPQQVVRWQQENPSSQFRPAADWAPRLPVDRLIYVEVEEFATRPPNSTQLFLGTGIASVYVYEIAGQGTDRQAELVFQDNDVRVTFPESAGQEGRPDLNDPMVYRGTVALLADAVATRFVPKPEED